MTTNRRAAGFVLAAMLASPSASAQSVADVLTFLVTNQSVSTGSVERETARWHIRSRAFWHWPTVRIA